VPSGCLELKVGDLVEHRPYLFLPQRIPRFARGLRLELLFEIELCDRMNSLVDLVMYSVDPRPNQERKPEECIELVNIVCR
jgi:hypothetical protein